MLINRRNALIAAATAAGCLVAFPYLADHSALSGHMDCDLCIVGAGGAGLAAAVAGLQRGLSVVLIEKLASIGGNTLRAVGMYNAAGIGEADAQAAIDRQVDITLRSGAGLNDPKVVSRFIEERLITLDWLQSLGVRFFSHSFTSWGGEGMEGVKPVLARGQSYIQALSTHFHALGGTLLTTTAMESLVQDNTGRVTGVLARNLTQDPSHPSFFIHAHRAVVLATGGFAANPQLLALWAPGYERLPTDNSIGSTGDGLVACQAIGAKLTNLSSVQAMPGAPAGRNYEVRLDHDAGRFILLDDEGHRFLNEDGTRDNLSQAILEHGKKHIFSITDESAVESFDPLSRKGVMEGLLAGDAFRAASLEELAHKIRMPVQALQDAVNAFNNSVDAKSGKCSQISCRKILQPPFWAAQVFLNVHSTLGGLAITPKTQVLSQNGAVISGLLAAGEIVGNLHGRNRIGGNGISSALTFGRLAALAV